MKLNKSNKKVLKPVASVSKVLPVVILDEREMSNVSGSGVILTD